MIICEVIISAGVMSLFGPGENNNLWLHLTLLCVIVLVNPITMN